MKRRVTNPRNGWSKVFTSERSFNAFKEAWERNGHGNFDKKMIVEDLVPPEPPKEVKEHKNKQTSKK